jgi:putative cell wall-binding protein
MTVVALATGALIALGPSASTPAAAAPTAPIDPGRHLAEFVLPNPGSAPNDIVAGLDGTVWISTFNDRRILQMGHDGAILQTVELTGGPSSLAVDDEGGVWATEYASNTIAHVSATGVLNEYPIPTPNSFPARVYDHGKFAFFTESATQKLGRIDEASGAIEEFDIPGASTLWWIDGIHHADLPSSQIWVSDTGTHTVQVLTESGAWIETINSFPATGAIKITGASAEQVTALFVQSSFVQSIEWNYKKRSYRYLKSGNTGVENSGFAIRKAEPWAIDGGTGTLSLFSDVRRFSIARPGDHLVGLATTHDRYFWTAARNKGSIFRLDTLALATIARIGGADRYETSAKLSQAMPATAPGEGVVFLVSGEKFADALSASPIAAALDAPVLLVGRNHLPDSINRELRRRLPKQVVVVGGESSISPTVLDEVRLASPGSTVTRIDGLDRYAVSRHLLASSWAPQNPSQLYVADGRNFPDALASGPAAARFGAGVLLIDGSKSVISPADRLVLESYRAAGEHVKIVGGPSSVSPELERQISAITSVTRLGGRDRFEGAIIVNDDAFPSAESTYLASGASFPDALAGGALAGSEPTPIFLARADCVPSAVLDRIVENDRSPITVLGGPTALDPNVEALRACD